MENLIIEGTKRTPKVSFNAGEAMLELVGRSIPDNAFDFYKPLYTWVKKYSSDPNENTNLHLNLEYCNTASSKCVIELIKNFRGIDEENKLIIHLYFDEEDEEGHVENDEHHIQDYKDFTKTLKCPVDLVIHTIPEDPEDGEIEKRYLKVR